MKCPFCGGEENRVVDSRVSKNGESVRRRRECLKCGRRFTTYEYVEQVPLMVIKRDGKREPFQRDKLLRGILLATSKRPIPRETIEKIVDEIESSISDLGTVEVTSLKVGEEVMERLKELDPISYIRFASVYRSFQDTGQLLKEVKNIINTQ
jgi:transcriptional repressor NrdR